MLRVSTSSERILFAAIALVLVSFVAPLASAQSADLAITKDGPAQSADDSDVPYNVTVTNLGPDSSGAVMLSDPIPAGMTFVSLTQNNGPAFSCDSTISCTAAALAPGASANFTFVFHITAGTPPGTTFTNIATVSAVEDVNEENNQASASTTTPPPPSSDLGVTKVGPDSAGPDTDVTYTIMFFNNGPDDAAEATLDDTLPGTMTFVSLSQAGTPVNCVTPAVGAGGPITCTAAPFAAGASTTLTLIGHIPAQTQSGTSFTNIATASGGNDFNEENNQALTAVVVSDVDVSVTKTGPGNVTAGNQVSYTIIVANGGPDVAIGVSLTDIIQTGTTFFSLNQDNGPMASCSTPLQGTAGQIMCTWPSLGVGASAQFTLVVNSGSAVAIANTATVSTDSFDSDTNNNTSTANTTVTQSADVSVTKGNGPGAMVAGTNALYLIIVNNAGPSTATSVQLTDALPANTTFVSLTQTSGPSFNCTTGATITCTIGSLLPGATANFDLVVAVASSTPNGTPISNTADIASATSDPTPGNNSSTTSPSIVTTSADVSVTKSGPSAVAPGADITYSVAVTNGGPSDAANVQLTDTLPAGTTFDSGTQTSGPAFSCNYPASGATGTITCTIATLPSGVTADFTFVFNIDPTATGTITNTASVMSTTPDPIPGNGIATTSPAAVSPDVTDMSITKSTSNAYPGPGKNVTYTIVATNNGPAVATNVVVTDVLPPGTTLVSATPSQGSCSGTTTVTCTAGTLLSGDSVTISLVVTMPQPVGPVNNTATVTSDNADSNPANNAAAAAVDVTSSVPSLSPLALALLALALAGVSLFVIKS